MASTTPSGVAPRGAAAPGPLGSTNALETRPTRSGDVGVARGSAPASADTAKTRPRLPSGRATTSARSSHVRVTSTDVLHMRVNSFPLNASTQNIQQGTHGGGTTAPNVTGSTRRLPPPTKLTTSPSISDSVLNSPTTIERIAQPPLTPGCAPGDKTSNVPRGRGARAIASIRSLVAIPPWATTNIRDPVKLKDLLRCWLASFTMFIFMLDTSTLRTIGSAAFFGLVVSFMIPVEGSFPQVGKRMVLFVFFVAVGWGYSLLAMKASIAVRNVAVDAESIKIIASSSTSVADLEARFKRAIFEGKFLDARASTIYGVFLFVGSFCMAFLRAYLGDANLMMPTIFGSILMDVGCSIGPLFPTFTTNIGLNFLLPISFYIAVSITALALIFPRSASYSCARILLTGLKAAEKIIELQRETLRGKFDHDRFASLLEETINARGSWASLLQGMHTLRPVLKYDIYCGHFSPTDYSVIQDAVFAIGGRLIGLCSVQRMFEGVLAFRPEPTDGNDNIFDKDIEGDVMQKFYGKADDVQSLREDFNPLPGPDHNRILSTAEDLEVMTHMLSVLNECTSDVFQSCLNAVNAIHDTIDKAEHSRYFARLDVAAVVEKLNAAKEELQSSVKIFKSEKWNKLMEPYKDHFDENGNPVDFAIDLNYKPLFLSLVMVASLPQVAEALVKVVNILVTIFSDKPERRFYNAFRSVLPSSLTKPTVFIDEELQRLENNDKLYFQTRKRYVPKKFYERYLLKPIYDVHGALVSPAGVYALKYSILTICTWLPSVFSTTAEFYYANRGLWAIIMGQTGMTVFAGEQLVTIFFRFLGTIFGLIIGISCWYIGSGSGKGNPYGLGVVVGVVFLPLLMYRLWYPRILVAILTCATVSLIVGYSYVNTHIGSVINPGYGIMIAVRRFVAVIIGLTVSIIMMLIPSPKSQLHFIQQRHATVLQSIETLTGKLIEVSRLPSVDDRRSKLGKLIRYLFAVNVDCKNIRLITPLAKAEPEVYSAFDANKYMEACDLEISIVESLIQLALTLRSADDPEWYDRVVKTGLFRDAFITRDILLSLHVMADCLTKRTPVPNIIPSQFGRYKNEFDVILQSKAMHISALSWSEINHPDFPIFANGMVCSFHMVIMIKRLEQLIIDILDEETILDLKGYEAIENSIVAEELEILRGSKLYGQSGDDLLEDEIPLTIPIQKDGYDEKISTSPPDVMVGEHGSMSPDVLLLASPNSASAASPSSGLSTTSQPMPRIAVIGVSDKNMKAGNGEHALLPPRDEQSSGHDSTEYQGTGGNFAEFNSGSYHRNTATRFAAAGYPAFTGQHPGVHPAGSTTGSSRASMSPDEIAFLSRHPELNKLGRDALRFAMMMEASSASHAGNVHTTGSMRHGQQHQQLQQQLQQQQLQQQQLQQQQQHTQQQHSQPHGQGTVSSRMDDVFLTHHTQSPSLMPGSHQNTALANRRSRSQQRLHNVYNPSVRSRDPDTGSGSHGGRD